MNSAVIQLIILAGIAIFLIIRLRNTLGTRDGFEKPPAELRPTPASMPARPDLSVIEGGIDHDIADYVDIKSDSGKALAQMKRVEPTFTVHDFLSGAKSAYEMLLTAFENGDRETLRQYLSDEVYASFSKVIETREAEGLKIDATIIGVTEVKLMNAAYDAATREGEIAVRFGSELTSVVRNAKGEIVEGNPHEVIRQKDIWTFAREMGSEDPNWKLVATGG